MTASKPKPFSIEVAQETLEGVLARVRAYQWHEMPEEGGWSYGTNLDYMKELCAYWADGYDWCAREAELNRLPQYTAEVDGLDIHFVHEKGSGTAAQPLLLVHGWPGSFYEFADTVGRLAHPERFGGDEGDAFDVIVPSLPGFGFSQKPPSPIGPRRVGAILGKLMEDMLGYEAYIVQGGDWGSYVATWMGLERAPRCAAIHLNMMSALPGGVAPETAEEKAWHKAARKIWRAENAYFLEQATKPQALSYAMMDSPVGIAAWIVEKFDTWSDLGAESSFSKDQLLTNVMIYVVSRTFNTASWIYRGHVNAGDARLPPARRIEVPVGVASFPREFIPWAPRSFIEKGYNVTHWTDMPRGGHFAAFEAPDLFVEDVRAFARTLKP